ncbi:hypothetical protein P9112_013073 [Eukaryota sp. TZLM1-RC]
MSQSPRHKTHNDSLKYSLLNSPRWTFDEFKKQSCLSVQTAIDTVDTSAASTSPRFSRQDFTPQSKYSIPSSLKNSVAKLSGSLSNTVNKPVLSRRKNLLNSPLIGINTQKSPASPCASLHSPHNTPRHPTSSTSSTSSPRSHLKPPPVSPRVRLSTSLATSTSVVSGGISTPDLWKGKGLPVRRPALTSSKLSC